MNCPAPDQPAVEGQTANPQPASLPAEQPGTLVQADTYLVEQTLPTSSPASGTAGPSAAPTDPSSASGGGQTVNATDPAGDC